ncbi:MAG: hypothetical protein H6R10_1921 [Rhodocyclaceae bacterium]|nr:hypothetical protein [Rhodocyclaceae bacterium]
MATYTDSDGRQQADRRMNPQLRELFDSAYAMIEPFFDPQAGWGGRSLEHLAFRVLRDNFPQLSAEEVHAVVVAAHRIYITRHPEGSEHLKRPEDVKRSF